MLIEEDNLEGMCFRWSWNSIEKKFVSLVCVQLFSTHQPFASLDYIKHFILAKYNLSRQFLISQSRCFTNHNINTKHETDKI